MPGTLSNLAARGPGKLRGQRKGGNSQLRRAQTLCLMLRVACSAQATYFGVAAAAWCMCLSGRQLAGEWPQDAAIDMEPALGAKTCAHVHICDKTCHAFSSSFS